MSHFTVLVVCPADTTQHNVNDALEAALAPFYEQVDNNSPYAVFHNVTEECRKRYEEEGVERIVMPDGRLLLPWDEEFRIEGTFGFGSRATHQPPEELEKRLVPYKETYPTLAEFITDWHGYRFNEQQGAFGYYHNPNAKWDWWLLGGRWQGMLTVKPEASAAHLIYGEPGVFGSSGDEYKRPDSRHGCDGCRKGDLDFDWAREENIRSVQVRWDHMIAENHQDDPGRRYFEYGFDKDSSLEDELQKAQNCHPFHTFAVLKGGVWYERGEMGWFACVINDKGRGEWCGEIQQLWDEIPDDHVVVVVDCHI